MVYDIGPPPVVGVSENADPVKAKNEAYQYIDALRNFTQNQYKLQKWTQIVDSGRYGTHNGYTFYENEGHISCLPGELSDTAIIKSHASSLVAEYNKVFDGMGKPTNHAIKNCAPHRQSNQGKKITRLLNMYDFSINELYPMEMKNR